MISLLPLLTILVVPLSSPSNPFLPEATVTTGWPPTGLHSILAYDLRQPPDTAEWMVEEFGSIGSVEEMPPQTSCDESGGPATVVDPNCPYQTIRMGCGDMDHPLCRAPMPEEIQDWSTLYQVEYTVVFWNWERWDWPRVNRALYGDQFPGVDVMNYLLREEILRHWQASMQTVNATLRRDLGLVPKVRHVHFMSNHDLIVWGENYNQFEPMIRAAVPSIPELTSIVLHVNQNGGLSTGGFCRTLMSHAWAGYRFDISPTDIATRNCWNRTIAHEFTHSLGMRHMQCYKFDGPPHNGENIEKADDGGACWNAPTICVPPEDISYMAYSWYCYEPPAAQCQPFRIGPYFNQAIGPLIPGPGRSAGRNEVLVGGCDCLTPIGTANLLDPIDTDGDEYPDSQDNCPLLSNNQQTDYDRDGKGDDCDNGCSIIPHPSSNAYPLLLPLLPLLYYRRTQCRRA